MLLPSLFGNSDICGIYLYVILENNNLDLIHMRLIFLHVFSKSLHTHKNSLDAQLNSCMRTGISRMHGLNSCMRTKISWMHGLNSCMHESPAHRLNNAEKNIIQLNLYLLNLNMRFSWITYFASLTQHF